MSKADQLSYYKVLRPDGTWLRSYDKGDRIAIALRGLATQTLKTIAKENGVQDRFKELHTQNDPRVTSRLRLYLGQMLRAQIRNGYPVIIQGKTIRSL